MPAPESLPRRDTVGIVPFVLLTLPLALLCGWAGHDIVAHANAGTVSSPQSRQVDTESPAADILPPRRPLHSPPTVAEIADAKRLGARLLKMIRESPNSNDDYPMMEEQQRLLDPLTAEELALVVRELDTTHLDGDLLKRIVLTAWAEKDPAAALDSLGSRSPDYAKAIPMCQAWILRDPAAALEWLRGDPATASAGGWRATVRVNAMLTLIAREPDAAFEALEHMDRKEAILSLKIWSSGGGSGLLSAEVRARALQQAMDWSASPEEAAKVRAHALESLAYTDADAAATQAATLDLPADKALELDASIAMVRPGMSSAEALGAWLVEHPAETTLPEKVAGKLATWMAQDSSGVLAWLETQPGGPQRDQFYQAALHTGLFLHAFDQSQAILDKLDAPEARGEALKTIDRIWPLTEPDRAAAWRAGLSESDQALLRAANGEE